MCEPGVSVLIVPRTVTRKNLSKVDSPILPIKHAHSQVAGAGTLIQYHENKTSRWGVKVLAYQGGLSCVPNFLDSGIPYMHRLQEYLAYKKPPPRKTLQ